LKTEPASAGEGGDEALASSTVLILKHLTELKIH